MVGHCAVEAQSTKPAVRQIEVHLFAQPPLRADAKAVADDQHADHQLRINRRPTNGAVKRRQLPPQPVEFDEPIDRSQQMPLRHMPFKRELVKQRVLLDLPLPHHRLPPSCRDVRLYRGRRRLFQQHRPIPALGRRRPNRQGRVESGYPWPPARRQHLRAKSRRLLTRPKPPQWTLSRHSVRPTAKQTGIFACCRIYRAPPVLAFRSARRLPARLLNNMVDWWRSAPGWAPFGAR